MPWPLSPHTRQGSLALSKGYFGNVGLGHQDKKLVKG
jgi:hypothetical protein